jgi:hypothetical protein
MFKPHQDLRADRTLDMQLEFHCPRRNRFAPNSEAQSSTLNARSEEKSLQAHQRLGGYVKEPLSKR